MGKTIELRDVPDEVYATLEQRAARAGVSVAEVVLREIGSGRTKPNRWSWTSHRPK